MRPNSPHEENSMTTKAKTTPAKATTAKTTPAKPAPAKASIAKTTPAKATTAKTTPAKATAAKATAAMAAASSHLGQISHSIHTSSARPTHEPVQQQKGHHTVTDSKINEAAEELAQTLRETYQTIVESTASTQERGVKLTQTLVENGIEELKSRAEATRSVIQSLTQPAEKPRGFRETYQTLVDTAVSTQERNVKFAQTVVENSIEELKSQTEGAQALVQALAQQSEKQRQALQTLARESVESYVNFLFAPLSFWQKGLDAAQEAAQEAAQR
jgi:dsDNA-specific endonuclease/ATPase MutS2